VEQAGGGPISPGALANISATTVSSAATTSVSIAAIMMIALLSDPRGGSA
jgi:hypothetical protein